MSDDHEPFIILVRRDSGERLWPIFDSGPGERVTVVFGSADAAQRFAYGRLLDGDWSPEELPPAKIREWVDGSRRAGVTHVLIDPAPDDEDHDAIPLADVLEELGPQ